jgi:hypothetical protein
MEPGLKDYKSNIDTKNKLYRRHPRGKYKSLIQKILKIEVKITSFKEKDRKKES